MAFAAVSGGTLNLGVLSAFQFGALDDTVLVLSGDNTILTWEGNDTVLSTRALANNNQDVNLGLGNDTYTGGNGFDTVTDGAGNDVCSLGGGTDFVNASLGNDRYDGGAGEDFVSFLAITADDGSAILNLTGVTFDLAIKTAQNLGIFGSDTFTGFEGVSGSDANDRLFGDAGANELSGNSGADLLDGRAGNDRLFGEGGRDILIGGAGKDFMECADGGLAERDIFRFLKITDSAANTVNCDTISLFDKGSLATDDRIDLAAIDANPLLAGNQAFAFRGAAAFTAASGEVRLVVSGADTFIHVDTDADAAAEMIIKVSGVTGLTKADFIL